MALSGMENLEKHQLVANIDNIDWITLNQKLDDLIYENDTNKKQSPSMWPLYLLIATFIFFIVLSIGTYDSSDPLLGGTGAASQQSNNVDVVNELNEVTCTSNPALTILSKNNRIQTDMYEIISSRISLSFYDAAAIKSDYVFHEYFKNQWGQRAKRMLERAAITVPIVWIAFSVIDVSAWWISNLAYLSRICANTLEFQAYTRDGFAQKFTATLLQFDNGYAVEEVRGKIGTYKYIESIHEVHEHGSLQYVENKKALKQYEKLVQYWTQKYADRFLKIMVKGWAIRIWQSVITQYDGGNLEEAEQCAFEVLAALTVYHPKTFHPLRIFRIGKDWWKQFRQHKNGKTEVNVHREKMLSGFLADNDKIPEKTKEMVMEYWKDAERRKAKSLQNPTVNQDLIVPNDSEEAIIEREVDEKMREWKKLKKGKEERVTISNKKVAEKRIEFREKILKERLEKKQKENEEMPESVEI